MEVGRKWNRGPRKQFMDRLEAEVPPGHYQHFKGNFYEVLGVARHSETEEELVVYRPLDGAGALWVRPWRMFLEQVRQNDALVPRFRYLGPPAENTATPMVRPG